MPGSARRPPAMSQPPSARPLSCFTSPNLTRPYGLPSMKACPRLREVVPRFTRLRFAKAKWPLFVRAATVKLGFLSLARIRDTSIGVGNSGGSRALSNPQSATITALLPFCTALRRGRLCSWHQVFVAVFNVGGRPDPPSTSRRHSAFRMSSLAACNCKPSSSALRKTSDSLNGR